MYKVASNLPFKKFILFIMFFVGSVVIIYYKITESNQLTQAILDFEIPTTVIEWKRREWIENNNLCHNDYDFNWTSLKTHAGELHMAIHPLENDLFVSISLKRTGIWDEKGVNLMYEELNKDPDIGLIDIGCHLGTYSLMAAQMGRHVIAVDPLIENVARLCHSIQENGLANYIIVVFSAISDTEKNMCIQRGRGNLGGSRVLEECTSDHRFSQSNITAVSLDKLVPLIQFQKVIVKLDIEGHEYFVFHGGKKLFAQFDVRGVLMEWGTYKPDSHSKFIIDFLTSQNFVPYSLEWKEYKLNIRNFKHWPFDVFWKRLPPS